MRTYTEMRSSVKSWLNDESPELEAALDFLIRLGELRIAREADLRLFRKHAFTTLVPGDFYLALPPECLVVREIRVTGGEFLRNRPETFMREYWPDQSALGVPKYYAAFDQETLMLVPTPGTASQVELTYTIQPAGLSAASPLTWLSTYAEDVLLYSILIEAAVWKQGMTPEQVALYRQEYTDGLNRLMAQETKNRYDEYVKRGTI